MQFIGNRLGMYKISSGRGSTSHNGPLYLIIRMWQNVNRIFIRTHTCNNIIFIYIPIPIFYQTTNKCSK